MDQEGEGAHLEDVVVMVTVPDMILLTEKAIVTTMIEGGGVVVHRVEDMMIITEIDFTTRITMVTIADLTTTITMGGNPTGVCSANLLTYSRVNIAPN